MTDKIAPQLTYAGTPDPLSLLVIAPKTAGVSTTDPTLNSYGDLECIFIKDLIAQPCSALRRGPK